MNPTWWKLFLGPQDQIPELSKQFVDAVETELEPYLADAKPYFGGSEKLTWVEIQLGSFLLFPKTFATADAGGLFPKDEYERLKRLKNFGPWFERVTEHPTILDVYDEGEAVKAGLKRREALLKAAAEKK